ncbi:PREDICTED: uncharacterized protein LOC104753615 [Camelina sativa]|uniref:Uncharacterized protein LOC104753615 n=1 Tax=Camelina sativa TaxID=90675 RepID=A0ABM0WPF3_CAMSA|nr:PREDICTED: uncharacterized protein LOC104753615 [Camelina sativa]
MRYNLMSSNVAECLNPALAKAFEFPIVSMIEIIQMMLMRWFYIRRQKANNTISPVTPEVEKKLMEHLSQSAGLPVSPSSQVIYQVNTREGVNFTVDLEQKTCTCKVFDTLGIPCCHALAAAKVCGLPVVALVDDEYMTSDWINTYNCNVMPVPDANDSYTAEETSDTDMLPPESKTGPGRHKKRRIPSVGEGHVSQKAA